MTSHAPCAFAIPGDIRTLTGGYIYERRLLMGLRQRGHDVTHLRLPDSFPDPSAKQMRTAVAALQKVGPARPLILDGLVFGAIETAGLASVRAPVIAMIHHPLALESDLSAVRRDHLFRTEYDNLRLARHVLVPSPHTRDILMQRYDVAAKRITVARPGIDPPKHAAAPVQPPLILSVGIQHKRKGHDILIEALTRLLDLDWRAVIVGSPWDADHAALLRAQLDRSGLASRLSLAGRVPADRLQRLYGQASIFALATRYEGYGIVFDEALLRGLPIVSCRVGAVPDTVPEGTGILVPPENADAFAAALRQLLSRPAMRRRLADAAALAGRRLPGWDQTALTAGGVIDRIAAGDPGSGDPRPGGAC
ncbi:glycosyltransferase family 4 protein [Paracoccus salsus]|uniref:glycosyltransferase family 4 protein n=1 Tax=Paracoccus salsus TaxID=2911061 RepID=UPI001F29CC9D|nr:glycosyltransferase family 4 protein [Paracoccus salsus]MCF3972770.1 glycosyltransferase family 4 protein [Paracoccus salsus]